MRPTNPKFKIPIVLIGLSFLGSSPVSAQESLKGRAGAVTVNARRVSSREEIGCGKVSEWKVSVVPDKPMKVNVYLLNAADSISRPCKEYKNQLWGSEMGVKGDSLNVYVLGDNLPRLIVNELVANFYSTTSGAPSSAGFTNSIKLPIGFIGTWLDKATGGKLTRLVIKRDGSYQYEVSPASISKKAGDCKIITETQIEIPDEGLLILKKGGLYSRSNQLRFELTPP